MRCRIPVQCDGRRGRSLTFDGLTKERLGRSNIAPGTEAKVHGVSRAVDRPIQIHPLAADLHVGLVDAPRRPGRPREPVPPALELWRIMVHPAHNGGVGHRQAALGHHLHQVPEAELEAQVPPHAQHDDLTIEVATLEQFVQTREPSHLTAFNASGFRKIGRPVNCTRAEETLFERRRSLFTDLSVVLFDTTSLYFFGDGGESLGRNGKSKDHRPDLHQVIVGVVLDGEGRPICSEIWPGNATDVKALLPVVTRLRERFGITRMCVVADRGMISAETIAELETLGLEYILGARERSDSEVRDIVLADHKPMAPLVIPRARGGETDLEVKEVVVGDWGPGSKPRRYVVCFNPEEAKRDAAKRAATLDSLRTALQQGDKQLVANAGYRRFLATPREGHFEIDPERVAEDARFDGLYVLLTNSKLPPLSIALAYR